MEHPVTFWIVWCPEGFKPPSHCHETEALAKAEAKRLAQSNRPRKFYVLRATHMSTVPPAPDCVTYTLNMPGISDYLSDVDGEFDVY